MIDKFIYYLILLITQQLFMESQNFVANQVWSLKIAFLTYYLRKVLPSMDLRRWIHFYVSPRSPQFISNSFSEEQARDLRLAAGSHQFQAVNEMFLGENDRFINEDEDKRMRVKAMFNNISKQYNFDHLIELVLKNDSVGFDYELDQMVINGRVMKQIEKQKTSIFNESRKQVKPIAAYDMEVIVQTVKKCMIGQVNQLNLQENQKGKMIQYVNDLEKLSHIKEIKQLLTRISDTNQRREVKQVKQILRLIMYAHEILTNYSSNNIFKVLFDGNSFKYPKGYMLELIKLQLLNNNLNLPDYIFVASNLIIKSEWLELSSNLVKSKEITLKFEDKLHKRVLPDRQLDKQMIRQELSITGQIQIQEIGGIVFVYEFIQFQISIGKEERAQLITARGDKTVKQCKIKQQLHLKIPADKQIWRVNQMQVNQHKIYQLKDIQENFKINIEKLRTFEEYGFSELSPLSLETFKKFTFEDDKYFLQKVQPKQAIRFPMKEYEGNFRQLCLGYIFSSIKKHALISSSIQHIKQLISHHSNPEVNRLRLWRPLRMGQGNYFNETFLIYHIINSAQHKLKVQLLRQLRINYPVPLLLLKNGRRQLLYEQHYWIHSKAFNILSFTLQNKASMGKSSLLNYLFNTNFQMRENLHRDCSENVEISFNVLQNQDHYVNVIDVSNNINEEIKIDLAKSCNLLLIHASITEKCATLQKIRQIQSWVQSHQLKIPFLILFRDIEEDAFQNYNGQLRSLQTQVSNTSFASISFIKISKQSRQHYSQIFERKCQFIQEFIKEKYLSQKGMMWRFSNMLVSYCTRNQIELNDILKKIDEEKSDLSYIVNLQEQLYVLKSKNDSKNNEKLKQIRQQAEAQGLSPLFKSILKYCKLNGQDIVQIIKKIKEFLLLKKNQLCKQLQGILDDKCWNSYSVNEIKNKLVQSYQKIINSKLFIVSNQKRQLFNEQLREFIESNSDLEQIKNYSKKLKDNFYNQIKSKIISIQLFWREFICMYKFKQDYEFEIDRISIKLEEQLISIGVKLIMESQAFELINGDILDLPKQFLTKIFNTFHQKRVMVIGIVGPQSSGKSTLLNFVLGCNFMSSVGRCTKGVYITYYEVSNKEKLDFDCILVVDTEGLISNYQNPIYLNRQNFDLKLLLLCTRICDIVIFNNRGDYTRQCKPLLELTFDPELASSENLPDVFFTMNMNVDQQNSDQLRQFQEFRCSIAASNPRVKQSLSNQNIFQLPFAFNEQNISILSSKYFKPKKIPRDQYINATIQLNKKLESVLIKRSRDQRQKLRKLQTLIKHFNQQWYTLNTYQILTKFTDKKKKILTQRIQTWMRDKEAEILTFLKEQERQFMKWKSDDGKTDIEKFVQQHQGKTMSNIQVYPLQTKKQEYVSKLQKNIQDKMCKFKIEVMANDQYLQSEAQIKLFIQNQQEKAKQTFLMKRKVIEQFFKEQQVQIDIKIASNMNVQAQILKKTAQSCSQQIRKGRLNEGNIKDKFDEYWREREKKFKQKINRSVNADALFQRYLLIYKKYLNDEKKMLQKYKITQKGYRADDISQPLMDYQAHISHILYQKFNKQDVIFEENNQKILFRLQKEGSFSNSLQYLNMRDFYEEKNVLKYIHFKDQLLAQSINKEYLYLFIEEQFLYQEKLAQFLVHLSQNLQLFGISIEYKKLRKFIMNMILKKYWNENFNFKEEKLQLDHISKVGHNYQGHIYIKSPKDEITKKNIKKQTTLFKYNSQFVLVTQNQIKKEKEYNEESFNNNYYDSFYIFPQPSFSQKYKYEQQLQTYLALRRKFFQSSDIFTQRLLFECKHLFEKNKKQLNNGQTIINIIQKLIQHYIHNLHKNNKILLDSLLEFRQKTTRSIIQKLNRDLSHLNIQMIGQSNFFESITTVKLSDENLLQFQSKKELVKILKQRFGVWWNSAKLKQSFQMLHEKSKKDRIVCSFFKFNELQINPRFADNKILQKYREQDEEYIHQNINKDFLQFIFQHLLHHKQIFKFIFGVIADQIKKTQMLNNQIDYKILSIVRYVNKILKDFNEDLRQIGQKLLYDFEIQLHSWAFHYFWKHREEKLWKQIQDKIFRSTEEAQYKKFKAYINKNYQAINEEFARQFVEWYQKYINGCSRKNIEGQSVKIQNRYQLIIMNQMPILKADLAIAKLYIERHQNRQHLGQKERKQFYIEVQDYFMKKRRIIRKFYYNKFQERFFEDYKAKVAQQINNNRQLISQMKRCFQNILPYIQKIKPNHESMKIEQLNQFLQSVLINSKYQFCLKWQINKQFIKDKLKEIKFTHIDQFFEFVTQFLQTIGEKLKSEIKIQDFKKVIQIQLCKNYCPCCKNTCGISVYQHRTHTIHKCVGGHHFRVVGGIFINASSQYDECMPSYYRCDQVKNQDGFQLNKKPIEWRKFKQIKNDWNFESANDPVWIDSMHKLWSITGQKICKRYKKQYIPFEKALKQSKYLIDYIFALDESGSMSGDKWTRLKQAVDMQLKQIATNFPQSLVNIIKFNDSVNPAIINTKAQDINASELSQKGGYTSYGPIFKKIYEMARQIKKTNLAVIFVTDGLAQQPTAEVQMLRTLKKHLNLAQLQFLFITIYIPDAKNGPVPPVLAKIKEALGGEYKDVQDISNLRNILKEVQVQIVNILAAKKSFETFSKSNILESN